jgi:hypothetical protein
VTTVTTPVGDKVTSLVQEIGKMFAVALEAMRLLFRRGLPMGEFLDQC